MSPTMPPQKQERQPGRVGEMDPEPQHDAEWYRGADKLQGKRALITGG